MRGDGSRVLTGAAVLDEAETGQLAFVGSAKYFASAAQSSHVVRARRATACRRA